MIRFKEKEFKEFNIDPVTAIITDQNGVVQETYMHQGRPVFKRMKIHQIMAHTFYGYKPGYDVHHLDENKLNNALSNLMYLAHDEHSRLHSEGNAYMLGKHHSEESKAKMSAAKKGKSPWNKDKQCPSETKAKISTALKGKQFSAEHKAKLSAAKKGKPTWIKGKHLSEESKAKMSAANKGKTPWNKGKHFSKESKD